MNTPANQIPEWVLYVLYVWTTLWAGIALWRSSRLEQRNWFIVFLILHTAGILEIIYLFYFAKKKLTLGEIKSSISKLFFVKSKTKSK